MAEAIQHRVHEDMRRYMTTPLSCFVRVSQKYGHYMFAISVLQSPYSLDGPDVGQSSPGSGGHAIVIERLRLVHHYNLFTTILVHLSASVLLMYHTILCCLAHRQFSDWSIIISSCSTQSFVNLITLFTCLMLRQRFFMLTMEVPRAIAGLLAIFDAIDYLAKMYVVIKH